MSEPNLLGYASSGETRINNALPAKWCLVGMWLVSMVAMFIPITGDSDSGFIGAHTANLLMVLALVWNRTSVALYGVWTANVLLNVGYLLVALAQKRSAVLVTS